MELNNKLSNIIFSTLHVIIANYTQYLSYPVINSNNRTATYKLGGTEVQSYLIWWRPLNGWDLCLGATQQNTAAAEPWGWSSVKSPGTLRRKPCRPHISNCDTNILLNWHVNPTCAMCPSYKYYLMFSPQLCFNWEYPAKLLALMGRFAWVRVAGNQRWWKQFQKPTGIIDLLVPESVKSSDLT